MEHIYARLALFHQIKLDFLFTQHRAKIKKTLLCSPRDLVLNYTKNQKFEKGEHFKISRDKLKSKKTILGDFKLRLTAIKIN